MNLEQLNKKVESLKQALNGFRTKIDSVSIDLDKESFKLLHEEAGKPTIHEPTSYASEYWFVIRYDGLNVFVNYKAKTVTTYEAL